MAGLIEAKQQQGAAYTVQSSGSSDLTNGSAVVCDTVLDNSANLAFWYSFELVGKTANGWGSAVGPGVTMDLYLVPALDGTNYADVDVSTPTLPSSCFVGSFTTVAASTTDGCRLVQLGIPLQPRKYKAYLMNNSGQTLKGQWALNAYAEIEQYT